MVAYAKSNPGKLSWGTGGLGATYAGFLRLLNAAGIDMLHVNYQGTPQAHNELMADRIDVVVNPHAASLPFVQAKRMKIIAACGPRRIEGFEKIAAVNETFPGVEITPYYALIAPRDTPTAIVRKIQADAAAVLNEPAFKEKIRELGLVVNITDPEQTDAAFRSETLEWARIAARIKLPPP
jgi:tripartite-type tricarboxylate transporter receptor subunit TctC